jgi:hypothetical protein
MKSGTALVMSAVEEVCESFSFPTVEEEEEDDDVLDTLESAASVLVRSSIGFSAAMVAR